MKLFGSMAIGISMYSKIPMPRVEWNKENMKYAICFFPLVGAVIGVVQTLLGTFLLKHTACGTLFFAGIMTIVPILISGGIHMDGLLDTFDALNSYADREKKLEILKDSRAGAFAVLGLGVYLVASLAVWSEIRAEMLPVIGAGYVCSRALSGLSILFFKPARKDGLGRTFQDQAHKRNAGIVLALWLAGALAAMLIASPLMGLAAAAAAFGTFFYYKRMAMKQFGGMTGDLAGYFLQLCELFVAAAVLAAGGLV